MFDCVFLKTSLVVCELFFLLLILSCSTTKLQGTQTAYNGASVRPSPSDSIGLSSSQVPANTKIKPVSGIRLVDFGNFTFPWYPRFLSPQAQRREITLHDKNFEVGLDNTKGLTPLTIDLEHVLYADLTEDGQEDAVVYLAGSVPTNSFLGNLLVYTLENEKTRILWQHETGDRGNGGLRGFRVENGSLIVEEYAPEVNEEQSLCCPKKFRRSYFRWKDKRFIQDRSEVLPNEYPNAYFVGYPRDQR